MAYVSGNLEFGRGEIPQRHEIHPSIAKEKGPGEVVGGAVGSIVDAVGKKVHKLFSDYL